MLEFPDKETSWLLKKRELGVCYRMESEEISRKRRNRESFAENGERSEAHNPTASSFDHKRKRLREDSRNRNNNIEEGYYHHRMSLDLELNLSPSLIDLNHNHDLRNYNNNFGKDERKKKMTEKGSLLSLDTGKSMTGVSFDLDDDGRDQSGGRGGGHVGSEAEMVARVCMKCHMLVMLCKASPACPNCKFMHSPEDTSLSLLFTPKPTLLA